MRIIFVNDYVQVSSSSFTSGDKMEEYYINNKINFVKVKEYNSLRASFAVFLYSMLKALKSIIPIDIEESLLTLENLKIKINSSNLSNINNALLLANWIKEIPIIYYPGGLESAAIRFKNSLQENSKTHIMIEEVVEVGHNVVSWEILSKFQPILLRGKDDYNKTVELWEILKEFFTEKKIKFYEIITPEGHISSKLVYLIYLLDYSTIYLLVMRGIDPSPIKSIDFIKSKIKSNEEK